MAEVEKAEELSAEEAAAAQRSLIEECAADRRKAKAAMLIRNAKRIESLKGKLKAGETLEEYDTRIAQTPDVRQ